MLLILTNVPQGEAGEVCRVLRTGLTDEGAGGVAAVDVGALVPSAVVSAEAQPRAAIDVLRVLVDTWERLGARRIGVVWPESWCGRPDGSPGQVAFWLRRRAAQRLWHVALDAARPAAVQAAEACEAIRSGRAPDAWRLRPWGPAPISIETPRLRLTVPTEEQIAGYYAAIAGSNIFDTLFWDGPASAEEMLDYWVDAQRSHAATNDPARAIEFAVIEKASNRMVGGASYRPFAKDPAKADLGYALAPDVHGRGYATEAVGALVDFGFERRGAARVQAEIHAGNEASKRVLEKLGFVLEGTCEDFCPKRGKRKPGWLMGLTRSRWSARHLNHRGRGKHREKTD